MPRKQSGKPRGSRSSARQKAKRGSKRASFDRVDTDVQPGPLIVVTGKRGEASKYARRAARLFDRGVQTELAKLARHGISTVAEVDGRIVRGVPVKRGGRYVVIDTPAPRKVSEPRRKPSR